MGSCKLPIWLQRRKTGSKRNFLLFSFRRQAISLNLSKTTSKKSYIPSKHSKLCSLHFKSENFATVSTDQIVWSKKRNITFKKEVTKKKVHAFQF